ncbi:MAG: hypothetical protein AAFP70_09395 [Calditrichota bacterium]
MIRLTKPIRIEVRKIEYENDKYILVEHDGHTAWLRKSQVKILDRSDLATTIEIPRRYYQKKF